jgi:hypothetical protein
MAKCDKFYCQLYKKLTSHFSHEIACLMKWVTVAGPTIKGQANSNGSHIS